ncbi:MAG: glutaredoxin 3 [Myxococcota bacterium]
MASPKVVVYSVEWCPYCRMARRLLDGKGVSYELVDVDGDSSKRAWLMEVTGQRTVPQVFIDDRPYGGYTDVAALDRRGELDPLLGLA